MRTFHYSGAALFLCLGLLCGCAVPYAAQSDDNPACRPVAGQVDIDGTPQQIVGRACRQPDGSWQIIEDDSGAVALYPVPVYPYYDPWYWGPVGTVGVGGSFVFVDRFHHFHHVDHVHFGHTSFGTGGHGGWHGASGMQGWGGMGGMSTLPHGGGGMRR